MAKKSTYYLKNQTPAGSKSENKRNMKQALILWGAMMAAYGLAGFVRIFFGISLVLFVNLFFLILCIIIALRKKQGLSSLGLTRENAGRSCKVGLLWAAVIVLLNGILPGIAQGSMLASPASLILWLLYYMLLIALPEELLFRGYLLTRLEAAMENSQKAIVVSGILFVLIHIPYQLPVSGMSPVPYLLNGNLVTLLMTFVWHLVFCWIFKKTQALYGAILFHGFMDWSNGLFIM